MSSITTVVGLATLVAAGGARPLEDDDICRRKRDEEREADRRKALERAEARAAERQRRRDQEAERLRLLEAGIDPTNGRPLTRQQRRARARR